MAIGIAANFRRSHAFTRQNEGGRENQAKGKKSAHVAPPTRLMPHDGSAIVSGNRLPERAIFEGETHVSLLSIAINRVIRFALDLQRDGG